MPSACTAVTCRCGHVMHGATTAATKTRLWRARADHQPSRSPASPRTSRAEGKKERMKEWWGIVVAVHTGGGKMEPQCKRDILSQSLGPPHAAFHSHYFVELAGCRPSLTSPRRSGSVTGSTYPTFSPLSLSLSLSHTHTHTHTHTHLRFIHIFVCVEYA